MLRELSKKNKSDYAFVVVYHAEVQLLGIRILYSTIFFCCLIPIRL